MADTLFLALQVMFVGTIWGIFWWAVLWVLWNVVQELRRDLRHYRRDRRLRQAQIALMCWIAIMVVLFNVAIAVALYEKGGLYG